MSSVAQTGRASRGAIADAVSRPSSSLSPGLTAPPAPSYTTKSILIMMGIPGAGKSTWVQQNVPDLHSPSVVVCSADDFMLNSSGQYEWRAERVQQAHVQALLRFEQALQDPSVKTIVLDNTNIKPSTLKHYSKLIGSVSHQVRVILIETDPEIAAARNKHSVPQERILKMDAQLKQTLSSGLPHTWELTRVSGCTD